MTEPWVDPEGLSGFVPGTYPAGYTGKAHCGHLVKIGQTMGTYGGDSVCLVCFNDLTAADDEADWADWMAEDWADWMAEDWDRPDFW